MRLTHAKLVLADQVVDASLTIEDGVIAGIDESGCGGEINCEGDYVIPGLIDLHTDSLERHYMPRPNVDWPPVSAAVIHDGNCVGHGVTTVFDSLSIGVGGADSEREAMLFPLLDGLAEAGRLGLLGADHRLHLRCEVTDDKLMDVLGRLVDRDGVSLVSLMDHTPGDRQYPDIEKYRANRKAWMDESEEEMEQSIADMLRRSREVAPSMREAVVRVAGERGLPIASHDDATQSHIEEAKTLGVTLAEFPTTTDTACRSSWVRPTLSGAAPTQVMLAPLMFMRRVCWISWHPTTFPAACWKVPSSFT